MWTDKRNLWRFLLCLCFTLGALAVTARGDNEVPSESQCRPYIEKALKELETGESQSESVEELQSLESNKEDIDSREGNSQEATDATDAVQSGEAQNDSNEDEQPSLEVADEPYVGQETADSVEAEVADDNSKEGDAEGTETSDKTADSSEEADVKESDSKEGDDSKEGEYSKDDEDSKVDEDSKDDEDSKESVESKDGVESKEGNDSKERDDSKEGDDSKESDVSKEESETAGIQEETAQEDDSEASAEDLTAAQASAEEADETKEDKSEESKAEDSTDESSKEDEVSKEEQDEQTESEEKTGDNEAEKQSEEEGRESKEDEVAEKESAEAEGEKNDVLEQQGDSAEADEAATDGETEEAQSEQKDSDQDETETVEEKSLEEESVEEEIAQADEAAPVDTSASKEDTADGSSQESQDAEAKEDEKESTETTEETSDTAEESTEQAGEAVAVEAADGGDEESDEKPVDELLNVEDVPENLRPRDHIPQILRLDGESSESELTIERSADIILRDLKRVYENSIKPLEILYKYRDLSNRHFGDPEVFSKPLVLFMGPWSGGKSSMVNYLTGIEFTEWSLRTGAEPSPAYFNILMHGKEPEVLDGTQLAADWTFSGLQKFGQGLEERLRGLKYPSPILEKVNIVEIPGILEVRKQVSRVFPFNDACQWFIDRADIIFLVYDPSKLDVGPETEAILDQLKGRESQTRILLNKADHVKPEELMRVQSVLIWNISPLMSSAQPPVMYTVSLWSMPFEPAAPVRLLLAQEKELLKDLRHAVDRRIENKIASARRFAVRVRNHAKMVDCYLTTYYNHKTIFGNKKLIAEAIIDNPQNYHIYEGLSTLTNISRYDLPDPETYRDFFRLNPLYEFQQLSATCTYFRGCPINRLDIAIAYDLPELVGKYKKMVETATPQGMPKS